MPVPQVFLAPSSLISLWLHTKFLKLGIVGPHDSQISISIPHVNFLFMHASMITMALMGRNPSVYTNNCLDSSCQFTLIAKILIANCPIARILIAKSTIAQILIAKSNNCPNTDCRNTDCRNTDCLNTGESEITCKLKKKQECKKKRGFCAISRCRCHVAKQTRDKVINE